jgi:pilus assembly protein TadC
MWPVIIVVGILAGLGLTLIVAQLLPKQPSLADAIERLGSTAPEVAIAHSDLESRVGAWVHRRMPNVPGFTIPTKDLALVGQPVNVFLFKKLRLAVLGLILPILIGVLAQLVGFPFYLPALLGIPIAIVFWFGPDRDLKKEAAEAREEFSRAVAIYLELVATERKRGAPAANALETAAAVGQSWVFVRIRQELTRARYAGVAPWDALTAFSEEISVPELADVAKIVRLSGEDGAAIYETLRARGRGLRVQLLNNEQTRANEISERMTSVPLAFLAIVFTGIIMTPFILTLVSS